MAGFWEGRPVLVTGGAGFLGGAVVEKLKRQGAEVIAPRSAQFDLTDRASTKAMFDTYHPQLVVHLAAATGGIGYNQGHPADLYLSNLLIGTHVVEEARLHDVGKLVLVGTICSYPKITPVPFREEHLWDGYPEETNAPYGEAKRAMLVHAKANHDQYGQRFIYLLPTNLYGPGDKFNPIVSHVIPALIKKLVDAKEQGQAKVEVWGTGLATREFLYVDDAAEGIVLAAEHYDAPDPVNLGANHETSIREVAETLARLLEYPGDLVWDPTRPDGQPRRRVDASKAEQEFGFRAVMPFEDGLRRTIDWYLANRELAERAP
ncbi:MAG: GDP-L-fucose synthase family protein [Acidimicrobiia bacterium]